MHCINSECSVINFTVYIALSYSTRLCGVLCGVTELCMYIQCCRKCAMFMVHGTSIETSGGHRIYDIEHCVCKVHAKEII